MVPIALATHSRAAGSGGARQLPEKRLLPRRRGVLAQVARHPLPGRRGPPPTPHGQRHVNAHRAPPQPPAPAHAGAGSTRAPRSAQPRLGPPEPGGDTAGRVRSGV